MDEFILCCLHVSLLGAQLREKDAKNELGKLWLSLEQPRDAETAYLCLLLRDMSGHENRRERCWPQVEAELKLHSEVRSLVAPCWPGQEREPFVSYDDSWQTTLPGWPVCVYHSIVVE